MNLLVPTELRESRHCTVYSHTYRLSLSRLSPLLRAPSLSLSPPLPHSYLFPDPLSLPAFTIRVTITFTIDAA